MIFGTFSTTISLRPCNDANFKNLIMVLKLASLSRGMGVAKPLKQYRRFLLCNIIRIVVVDLCPINVLIPSS